MFVLVASTQFPALEAVYSQTLLFGDAGTSVVQQGWELKMPDTLITDAALLENAEAKARRLGLNSFLVWNGNEAALHMIGVSGSFAVAKAWV